MPSEFVIKIFVKFVRLLAILGEHETVKYVKVDRHVSLSICKWGFQICVVAFTAFHQLWHAKGYQHFSPVKATFTTKVSRTEHILALFVLMYFSDDKAVDTFIPLYVYHFQ